MNLVSAFHVARAPCGRGKFNCLVFSKRPTHSARRGLLFLPQVQIFLLEVTQGYETCIPCDCRDNSRRILELKAPLQGKKESLAIFDFLTAKLLQRHKILESKFENAWGFPIKSSSVQKFLILDHLCCAFNHKIFENQSSFLQLSISSSCTASTVYIMDRPVQGYIDACNTWIQPKY